MVVPTEFPNADPHTNAEVQGNLLRDHESEFEQLPEDQKLSKLCSDARLKIVEKGQFFMTVDEEGADDCDLWGRKINYTSSKTLVGGCRDRPKRLRPFGWVSFHYFSFFLLAFSCLFSCFFLRPPKIKIQKKIKNKKQTQQKSRNKSKENQNKYRKSKKEKKK